jgi:hypothetical protein
MNSWEWWQMPIFTYAGRRRSQSKPAQTKLRNPMTKITKGKKDCETGSSDRRPARGPGFKLQYYQKKKSKERNQKFPSQMLQPHDTFLPLHSPIIYSLFKDRNGIQKHSLFLLIFFSKLRETKDVV